MPAPRITRISRQTATLARLPATGARRNALMARRAAHYVMPPTDGTFSEWLSWGSEQLVCIRCDKQTVTRTHLVICAPESGGYALLRQCECGYIHEDLACSRQEVIDVGTRLRGWQACPEWQSLQRELDRLRQRQRQRESVRAALRGSSGGSTGGRGA